MPKRTVLLTGASGLMGTEAFQELLRRRDQIDIVLLLLPLAAIRRAFSRYAGLAGVRIVWGSVCDPPSVGEAVRNADHVLHVAALTPPAADHQPGLCGKVNFEGTRNILDALRARPGGFGDTSLVYVSSVAVYGDRLPPAHMISVGDPVRPSLGDFYATTKARSEREIIESGMTRWAILRQTYIAIPRTLSLMSPLMFHQPLDTHIELITSRDAGFGVVQTIEAPDDFYGRVYNMGGGPSCRVVYRDYMDRVLPLAGVGPSSRVMRRNWFALRNFHCGWYADGADLNAYLGHQRSTLDDHYRDIAAALPAALKFGARVAPAFLVRAYLKRMADPPKWIRDGDDEKITAFLGSREAWEQIPPWDQGPDPRLGQGAFEAAPRPSPLEVRESMPGMQSLAATRGGICLSAEYAGERAVLGWRCGFGHEWKASPTLVRAGHWCPECVAPPWNYDEVATADPALARLHHLNHGAGERQVVARPSG